MEAILFDGFQSTSVSFNVGDIVSNFGQVGRIVEIHHSGNFVLRAVGGKMKWLASPSKCSPVL